MKTYRNAERTKKWIRRAFTELMAEKKDIEKISVTELAKRADISKTTFYYHYEDIYAVAEEFENELVSQLGSTLETISKENPDDYSKYAKDVVSFIKKNEESYRLVINSSNLTIFASKLKTIFSKRMVNLSAAWGFSSDYEKRTVQVYFFVSACVDTIIQYLKGDLCDSLDTVDEVVTEVIDKLKRKD
ncbi:MAG TPA: hypothetical protein DCS04_05765 [Ruminococcaceae bacterium]|nr:hypothetical protein [Oscillospiraceae bacterium]